jgi:hypothetical protein
MNPSFTPYSPVVSEGVSEIETESRGVKIAVGITIAIVGFFLGWVIATNAQDTSSTGSNETPVLTIEIG